MSTAYRLGEFPWLDPQELAAPYTDPPTLIIGTHFGGPTAGRIARDGDVLRFDC